MITTTQALAVEEMRRAQDGGEIISTTDRLMVQALWAIVDHLAQINTHPEE